MAFSYAADNDDELSLDTGDIVEVLGEEEDGWWSGTLKGKTGVFPNNFVEEISEEEGLAALKKAEVPSKAEAAKSEGNALSWLMLTELSNFLRSCCTPTCWLLELYVSFLSSFINLLFPFPKVTRN